MTARKPSATDRITQAYKQLLASTHIKPGMPDAVCGALIREGDFIESCVLANLIGCLGATAGFGRALSPTRLAEMVEDACAEGEAKAARAIAAATTKETDR